MVCQVSDKNRFCQKQINLIKLKLFLSIQYNKYYSQIFLDYCGCRVCFKKFSYSPGAHDPRRQDIAVIINKY